NFVRGQPQPGSREWKCPTSERGWVMGLRRRADKQLQALWSAGVAAGMSDGELLDRFLARRDHAAEVAFSALVTRHGAMVLKVCTDMLGDRHDAEDAFQATFLVLARRAGAIREPSLLGPWLYGVALRTAKKARAMRGRRVLAVAAVEPIDGSALPDAVP